MSEKQYRTVYIRRDSKRPVYAPFPVFLMDYDLSMTARVLYALMFNRAMLSQINNWVDDLGRVFIVMTIPFRCAEGTKRHETGASNAAINNLLECT